MQATLIHPWDLSDLLNDTSRDVIIDVSKSVYDDLIEINGELYYQTTRVPAKTKNLV
jgi:hypothetical protein